MTQLGLCPMQVHDLPSCRLLFETAPVLRKGDLLLEDRGFLDGATLTLLKQQRHVDVIVPLKATRLSYKEVVQLAVRQNVWHPHPSRAHQHIAFVPGMAHVWDEGVAASARRRTCSASKARLCSATDHRRGSSR
jgi:hypothetical protein